jgi:hypothetical protein
MFEQYNLCDDDWNDNRSALVCAAYLKEEMNFVWNTLFILTRNKCWKISFFSPISKFNTRTKQSLLYRVFRNVLCNYKHLQQENQQRTYLNGIVHSHRETEISFFLTTRDVRCAHHGWHGTHPYDIQVVATHASTCSIKVGPLVFLLQMFVITENIMKCPLCFTSVRTWCPQKKQNMEYEEVFPSMQDVQEITVCLYVFLNSETTELLNQWQFHNLDDRQLQQHCY